jgi:hypothetical protein
MKCYHGVTLPSLGQSRLGMLNLTPGGRSRLLHKPYRMWVIQMWA